MEVSTSSMSSKPEQIMQNSPPTMISSPRFQPHTTRSPHHHDQHQQHLSNPYPTTFVQADTSTFKQVVQMLTGSSTDTNTGKHHEAPSPANNNNSKGSSFSIPPIKKTNSFKLYERRQNNNNNNNMFAKNDLMINTLRLQNSQRLIFTGGNSSHHQSPRFSPRNSSSSDNILLSPSMLDFPKLGLNSPVTPLRSNDDPFNKSSPLSLGNSSEEEKAIAEKGFYLHPSPVSTPRDSQPLLLPLFPVTSPARNP
ncbi:PREDICTED: VQ motif-containing protein 33 [Camelina sativa]|uniref:VQ motif-containing protein 33 n=1 Tax=Camelina sativa TaxID=90675 RepID=A0ABM0UTI4_CAMSA|nr:PREDICTED: VQ motif-containing protein 33 [Camelina sativa]